MLNVLSPQCLPVSRIVGVEMSQQAVEDARENARLNGEMKTMHVCVVMVQSVVCRSDQD